MVVFIFNNLWVWILPLVLHDRFDIPPHIFFIIIRIFNKNLSQNRSSRPFQIR